MWWRAAGRRGCSCTRRSHGHRGCGMCTELRCSDMRVGRAALGLRVGAVVEGRAAARPGGRASSRGACDCVFVLWPPIGHYGSLCCATRLRVIKNKLHSRTVRRSTPYACCERPKKQRSAASGRPGARRVAAARDPPSNLRSKFAQNGLDADSLREVRFLCRHRISPNFKGSSSRTPEAEKSVHAGLPEDPASPLAPIAIA